jgi:hypothetical protein
MDGNATTQELRFVVRARERSRVVAGRNAHRYTDNMDINCPKCRQTFSIPQKWPYHAGFGNLGVYYCDSCPNLVTFSSFDPRYQAIVGKKLHPWTLRADKAQKVERLLKPCPCGGRFRYTAEPRCPLCNETIRSVLPASIYFIETGKRIDSEKENIWKSRILFPAEWVHFFRSRLAR